MRSFLVAAALLAVVAGAQGEAAAQVPPAKAVQLMGGGDKPKGGGESTPAATPYSAKAAADAAVLGEIEKTLKDLSSHVRVEPRRLRVSPPARAGAVDLPAELTMVVGKSAGLTLPGDAREVVVGNPEVADVAVTSRRRIFVLGRKAGRTNVAVLDERGDMLAHVEVLVSPDLDVVRNALARQLPGESLEVASEGTNILLSGDVRSDGIAGRAAAIVRRFVDKDEELVNLMKVNREQQVLLQVRVSEVQRDILKELGARMSTVGPHSFLSKLSLSATTSTIGATALDPVGTLLFTGIHDTLFNFDLLEQRGLVRNLAEPNLVAVSGELASMLAGGEYPVPVPDDDGIKIDYKPFGVTLSFVPVVLDSGKISLKLTTEVSGLSSVNTLTLPLGQGVTATVPSFVVRRASSSVELPSGGSLMIAGLIQNDMLSSMSGLPGIMDVPVLGGLFRSDSFRRNETELVVTVTASLVRPTAPSALVLPTDAISPGGDLDTWLFGKLLGSYSPGYWQDAKGAQPLKFFGYTIDEFVP